MLLSANVQKIVMFFIKIIHNNVKVKFILL